MPLIAAHDVAQHNWMEKVSGLGLVDVKGAGKTMTIFDVLLSGLACYGAVCLIEKTVRLYQTYLAYRQAKKAAAQIAKDEAKAFRVAGIAPVLEEEYGEYVHSCMESELYDTKHSGDEFYVRHRGQGPWVKVVKVEQKKGWE